MYVQDVLYDLRHSAVKVEDVALRLIVPDGGLVLQLQQPLQVLALILLCSTEASMEYITRWSTTLVAYL